MKTVLETDGYQEILQRLETLRAEAPARWGRMNAGQMVCHVTDQLRLAMGEISSEGQPSWFGRTVMKWLIMAGMPAPKGKVKTMKELDQEQTGTPPTTFEADVAQLKADLERFRAAKGSYQAHPAFGPLTDKQWGKLAYIHLDHHFQQFGI